MRVFILFSAIMFSLTSLSQTLSTEEFKLLRLDNKTIRDNDTINERIVDLVEVRVADSIITKRKQHHRLFLVGWTIHAFAGYNWRAIEFNKQKFVGTVHRSSRSNSAEFTEHDVNFDLYFNTNKYLYKVFQGYDKQKEYKRQDFRRGKHLKDYSKSPYTRDIATVNKMDYRLHIELTPPETFRRQLNYLFYPVFHDKNPETHPNILDAKPTFGAYGVYCSDCNHSCHNELHPYEWLWWMHTHNSTSTSKSWTAGLLKESSNRFPDWSASPKIGSIAIPFSFDKSKKANITIQPLCFGELIENGAWGFVDKTAEHFNLDFDTKNIIIKTENKEYPILIKNLSPLQSSAVIAWISVSHEDKENNTINGFLHFSIATKELFTFKVKFEEEK
jgi:hypothetical protein